MELDFESTPVKDRYDPRITTNKIIAESVRVTDYLLWHKYAVQNSINCTTNDTKELAPI